MKVIYTGWFVNANLIHGTLEKKISTPHITLDFKPTDLHLNSFGTKAIIKVIGYGNDGKNEGYLCQIEPEDKELAAQVSKIAVPHLTLSVSKNGKPVDTAKLEFQKIQPFSIIGTFGAFTPKGVITEGSY